MPDMQVSIYEREGNKYPFVRFEETYETNEEGERELVRVSGMVADHIMVKVDPSVSREQFEEYAASNEGVIRRQLGASNIYLVSFEDFGVHTVVEKAEAFLANPVMVLVAEPDFIGCASAIPNDPSYSSLYGMQNIQAPAAWDVTTGSSSVVVGVVDTGMNLSHPDLVANLWTNPGETPGNGIDDDSNGYIDDVNGWDFYDGDNDPSDDHGHGTHVSGTIGAEGNNATGVAGVCWQVSLVPLDVMDPAGFLTYSDAVEAINYSVAMGFPITNHSWGGASYSSILDTAVTDAQTSGVLMICAAGNDSYDVDVTPEYPACLTQDNVISVLNTTDTDTKYSNSNWGLTSVDLAAPGWNILSTKNSTYATMTGTSMAAPHVTGTCALMLANNPSMTYTDIRTRLLVSVDPVASLSTQCVTGGRLNTFKALSDNLVPVANNVSESTDQDVPVVVTMSGSDPDSGPSALTYVINTPPSAGTLSAVIGNQVTYTPNAGFGGIDSFTYTAFDGQVNSNIATVTISVVSAGTLINEDFQSPMYTSGTVTPAFAGWTWEGTGKSRTSDVSTDIPCDDYPTINNQVIQFEYTANKLIRDLAHNWSTTDVFVLTVKASPQSWNGTQDRFIVPSLRQQDDTVLWTVTEMLPYYNNYGRNPWTAEQQFQWTIPASGFTAGTPGQPLRFKIESSGYRGIYIDDITLNVSAGAPTYTVSYDGNGHTGGSVPGDQTKDQGVDLALATNSGGLVKSGFVFAGWNTATDGTGTSYAEGALYTVDADLTLHAKWDAAPTYTVSYDGNGHTGGAVPGDQTKTQGIDLTLATNSGGLVKSGFSFSSWNTNAAGTGTDYAEGATYTTDAAVTLFAKWISNSPPTVDAGVDQTDTLTGTGGGSPVAGAYYEWDAAADTAGDSAWNSTTANAHDWVFDAGALSPVAVSDARFDTLTVAYEFPGAKDSRNEDIQTIAPGADLEPATFEFVLDVDGNDGVIFETGGTGDGFAVDVSGGAIRALVEEDPTDSVCSYTLTAQDLGRFIHVVIVIDNVNDVVQLYIDGVLQDSQPWTAGEDWSGTDDGGLGAKYNSIVDGGSSVDFTGKIALMRFYRNKAFDAAEVTTNFDALSSGASAVANLDGTVTDPESDPFTNLWTVTSGPGSVVFGDDTAVDTTATFDTAGTYVLRLTADDSFGQSFDEVTITVDPAGGNTLPVFAADPFSTADATANASYADTIAGSATDADGDTLEYAKVSGPAWLSVATDGTLSGTPSGGDVGLNAFTVSVTDNIDAPVTATLNITVNAPNTPPTVDAGLDQTVSLSEGAPFTPGISYEAINDDADCGIDSGKVYTHAVDFGSDTPQALINGVQFQAGGITFGAIAGTSATIGTGTTTIPSAHGGNASAAPYLNGASACAMEDLVEDMNYNNATGEITLTGLTPGVHYQLRLYHRDWNTTAGTRGQNIGFETDGVGTDITGCEHTATFMQDDASQPDPSFGTFSQVYALTYDYTLAAGVTSLKVYINKTTNDTYHLYGLTNEDVGGASAVANLDGTVSDPEQTPTTTWTTTSGPGVVTYGDAAAVDTTATFYAAGTYVLRLTADDGIDQTFDEVTITVNDPATNSAPVFAADPFSAGDATADAAYGDTIAGSATDADGDTLEYAKVSGPAWLNVALDGTLSGTPTNADVGLNAFTVSVTDNIAAPVTATLNITVNAAPVPDILVGPLGVWSPTANGGINPATGAAWAAGDTYRLAFVTSTTRTADAPDLSTYDAFVQGLGDAAFGGGTWKVIGSSATVDVRDHTATNPTTNGTGVGVFLTDGVTMIAGSHAELWDNGLDAPLNLTETGEVLGAEAVATGSFATGVKETTQYLGASPNITHGRCTETGAYWMRVYNASAINPFRFYALSDPLTVFQASPTTLASGDIVDDRGGVQMDEDTLVTYTLTFSDDIDHTTVDAGAFSNAGTTPIVVGAITEVTPGVFTVEVTPTQEGTLRLQVSQGAVIHDVGGLPIDTTSAIQDNTEIWVEGEVAPVWTSTPVVEIDGYENAAYSSTLADDTYDADGNQLTYTKVSGPAWLVVAADGTLSGTPGTSDIGLNTFTVEVTDSILAPVAGTIEITVQANAFPVFAADPFTTSDAFVATSYTDTLAGSASDADGDGLSYSMVFGRYWLTIASDGTLSGTPTAADVGLNSFIVSVSDGIHTPVEAVLNIIVHESATVLYDATDTDADGIPDAYELANTTPASTTSMDPNVDSDTDGLTNWQEFSLNTDPNNPDTDGDGLDDGPELAGVGARPATDPLAADSDADGLSDNVETNTGSWVSAGDTGTNPMVADTDGDGLLDGVETNTGVFVDVSDTGSNPLLVDTDADGAGDWYEVAAAFTDPSSNTETTYVPYPLPDPDASTGNTVNPVKVYILAGEDNMVGHGTRTGTGVGTLNQMFLENKFPNLFDDVGGETVRNDVKYRGVLNAVGNGPLQPGYGDSSSKYGPELGFGHVMGWYHDEPVLIIKASANNVSLGYDVLPPNSAQYVWRDFKSGGRPWMVAGYGDIEDRWDFGGTAEATGSPAGTTFNEFFMDESDWIDPGATAVENVADILDNFATEYPEYAAQGFEISGYVWWQGQSDQSDPYIDEYAKNMAQLIKEMRSYYETRYPANTVVDAPFVLATVGNEGWTSSADNGALCAGQLSVSGETGAFPEFAGNVRTVDTRSYYRTSGPDTKSTEYWDNAETFALVGDALARAMVDLKQAIAAPAATAADVLLTNTFNALTDHINGVTTMTAQEMADAVALMHVHHTAIDDNATVISAAMNMVQTYESVVGPLWADGTYFESRSTEEANPTIDWAAFIVMKYFIEEVYDAETLAAHEVLLDGYQFESADYFPGACAPPADPNNVHTATIDASFTDTFGRRTAFWEYPARKPTGTYLAPGTLATVTVPPALVGSGYHIRVGAHTYDLSGRTKVMRLDRASSIYPIDSTITKIASPYGGSIYIEVPLHASAGVVTVDVTGAVRAPFFSAKSFHTTTLSEWQNSERNHPGPWADFQTEKYMMTVPTDWIYAWDDPAATLADWDLAVDAVNDTMGFPHVRGKESFYDAVDVLQKSSVFSPGYPQINTTYTPSASYGGQTDHFYLNGPDASPHYVHFHEHGHDYRIYRPSDADDEIGEGESDVHLLYVAAAARAFGKDLDASFRSAFNNAGYTGRTVDTTAVSWMTCFNFSPREDQMQKGEKVYQIKSLGRFMDTVRLFGWTALDNLYYQYNYDLENGVPITNTNTKDGYILRASQAAGVDMRPLIHFWGMFPEDDVTLAADLATAGLNPSKEIYDLLRYYQTILPKDNAEYQAWATTFYSGQPDPGGGWTEWEHARQWDTEDIASQSSTPLERPNGEIYDESAHAEVSARVQEIIDLYFPAGDPDPGSTSPPSPDPMTFAVSPATTPFGTVDMTATTATDLHGPVEYYFENTTNSSIRDWSTDPYWDNSGLTEGISHSYRVKARDALGYETAWSTVESATPIVDVIPPTLAGTGFVDSRGGVPTQVNYPMTYTITFSEDMDETSVDVSDFSNGGTAVISITSVVESAPGVFTLDLSPTAAGTLQLQVNAGAVITDVKGNALDTTSAIADDTTITINALPNLTGPLGVLDTANANAGLNPATGVPWAAGDSYRIVFVTNGTSDAVSTDLATYDAFVQAAADAVIPGATWKVIGSTTTVEAQNHTGINPAIDGTGVPIFLVDGLTKIADDNTDLWDGSIDAPIDVTELGVQSTGINVGTGATPSGGISIHPLGDDATSSNVTIGNNSFTTTGWVENFNSGASGAFRFYAISEVLTLSEVSGAIVTDITDDRSGAPVEPNTLVTYTVTFSQDMDDTTVDAADFANAGTALVTVGTITETSPGVFTVEVTPTAIGTLQLQVPIGAVLSDAGGLPFDSVAASTDDTTIIVDNAPVANNDSVITDEDNAVAITLVATDVDPGTSLDYTVVGGPSNGSLSGTAPDLTYTPDPDFNGADSFTFKANDGTMDSNIVTVSITVNSVNDVPEASDGSATTDEDTSVAVTLVASDNDPADVLNYIVVSVPANGSLSGTGANLTYTPAANFNGADSFTFKVNDGTVDSNVATVSITVNAVNDVPVVDAGADQVATLVEGGGWTPGITYEPITDDADSGISSSKVYTHAVDFGADTPRALINGVQFQAGGTTFGDITGTSATVGTGTTTIAGAHGGNSSAAPYLNGASYCAMEDLVEDMNYNDSTAEITLTGLTPGMHYQFRLYHRDWNSTAGTRTQDIGFEIDGVGTDITGCEYTAVFNQDNASQPDPGFATFSQVYALTFDYTLPAGVTSLTVYVNNTAGGTYHLYGLTNEEVSSGDGVLVTLAGTASDIEGPPTTTWSIVSGPATVLFDDESLLNATATFTEAGIYVLRLTVDDGSAQSTDDVTITVNPIGGNNAPVWTSYPVNEVDATEDAAYAATLADDATDADTGDTLSFAKVSGPAWLSVATDGTLSGTPTNADVGANAFTVSVTDGVIAAPLEATLNITVLNTNDAPTFIADPIAGSDAIEDATYAGTIAGSATDPDTGDSLSYAKTGGPAWLSVAVDGTLSGTPTNADVGVNAFTVSVDDGVIAAPLEATLNITVLNTNDAPTFTADPIAGSDAIEDATYAGTIAGSATDSDTGDSLSYAKTGGPAWLSVAVDGTLSGTPMNADVGVNAFTVTVDDGNGGSDTATLNITVINTNDAPVFTVDPITGSDAEENAAYSGTIAGTTTDDDGDAPIFAKTSGPAWLTVASDGTLGGTPANGDIGANAFTVSVSDGNGGSDTAALNIMVNAAPSVIKLVRTTVSAVSSTTWTTVDLGQSYNSLVVVATPILPAGVSVPVVTRITNVTSSGFDLKLDRVDGLSSEVNYDVSVVAVEEGVYTQANDGVTMEAVKVTSVITSGKGSWNGEAQSYQNSYTNPVVVGQVMSTNDSNWSAFWSCGSNFNQPVDAANLNVGKHVGEDPNGVRSDELIGYIVIEAGNGTMDGVAYEAAIGSDSIQGFGNSATPYSYTLSGTLSTASGAALSSTGMDGADGAWPVLSGASPLTPTQIDLYAAEDQINDSEQNHTSEQINYIVFE